MSHPKVVDVLLTPFTSEPCLSKPTKGMESHPFSSISMARRQGVSQRRSRLLSARQVRLPCLLCIPHSRWNVDTDRELSPPITGRFRELSPCLHQPKKRWTADHTTA